MRFKGQVGLCVLTLALGLTFAEASAQTIRSDDEQSHFGAETPVRKTAEIPGEVLSILRQDKRNQTCLEKGESPTGITSDWFVGSRVQLNAQGPADLLVTAANNCLLGANTAPFWVFRMTPQGYQLVLEVNALGLDLLNTKTNSYRDIRTGVATASSVNEITFKFDKSHYRPSR